MEENSPNEAVKQGEEKKVKISWSVQDFLSLGYIYLLLVGIAGDSIYYSYLGINILGYSNVIDVLLSPIVTLIEVPLLGIMLLCIPLVFGGVLYLQRRIHLKNREKPEYQAKHDMAKLDESLSPRGIRNGLIIATAFAIFSGFIGFGWGGGGKMKDRMESGDFRTNTIVHFIDGTKKEVRLVGHNSEYLFYIEEGKNKLSIAPIPGNVKMVKELEDSDKDSKSSAEEN